MFGRTHFNVGTKSLPVIRSESLVTRAGLSGVYIVDDELRVNFRWLRLGKVKNGYIEVLVGLKGGERIILLPDGSLRDGNFIQLKDKLGG